MVLENDLNKLYPFSSRYFTVESQGQKETLHYIDEGQGDPVVMLHGNPTWSFYYRNIIRELKKRHRAIAVDHIGSGLSGKPENYPYRLENHIDNLSQLIKHLDLNNITLIVHDWGGAIGFGWAVQHLDRVKKIVITNTAAFLSQDIPKRISILRTPLLGEKAMRHLNLFAWPATFMATQKGLSPLVKKGLLAPYKNYRTRIGIARFVQDIPLKKSHPSYNCLANIERQLKNISCPILILWGMKDFCFHSKFLDRWQEIYPKAKVHRFEEAGHYLFEDDLDASIAQIVQFVG